MTASGQRHRFDQRLVTSGLPQQADIFSARRDVSKVPKGDTARTQGTNRICRQAAGNCERVIGGAGFAVDGLG
jgi:hypothetical protein